MADAVNDPRLEFDAMLRLAIGAPSCTETRADWTTRSTASIRRASRDPALVYLAVAPQWDNLRGDPRFGERLKRLALA